MPSLTLLYLLTLLSLANISTGSAHNPSNSSSPSPTPTVLLTPGYPVIPDQTLADSDSSPSGPSIGIASYVSLLRNNDFYGQWVLTGNSNNLESFQNTNGIFELDAVASNTTYTGNYTPTTTVVNPNPARLLVETVDLDPEATDNESSDTNTLIQLLIKIYDGEYYDQQSIQIKYTLGSTGNLVFSPSMATIYENYQLSGLSFTKPDGTEVADQSCTLNISMTFFNENTLTPYQGPFTSPSALGITVNITSSDCDFSLQTSLLTTNGLYTKTQVTVYIIVSCIIFMIQSAGVYLVRKSLEKKKYLFNMSASSIFFAVALDYYVLISNLVMVFADSTLLLIPLVFNIILTFGLERDVIIKLFQGRAKRPGTTLSDEDCKACGCYFVVIAVFFVIELAFLLMYQLWILYFTTLVLVPQIVQNIYKDRPYKFNYPYVFLMVAPKILMIAYLRLYSGNLFRISPDPVFAITYAVPILIQISMLAIQTTYPRFCLSAGHVRKARRALEEDDLCPICMGHLACNNSDISPTLPRRKTIQTTCTHSFHTQCLKKWLNTKTECPMCRNNIAELLEEVDFSEDETRSADLNSPDFRSPGLLRVQNVEYSGGAYLEHNL